jgi:hypothetical protein
MMDGMPMVRYADYLVTNAYTDTTLLAPLASGNYGQGGVRDIFADVPIEKLKLNEDVVRTVGRGTEEFNKLVGEQELTATVFRGFGAKDIKVRRG